MYEEKLRSGMWVVMSIIAKHLRRICPALIVADAQAAAMYYKENFGFSIGHCEGTEFAIVSRDDCRVLLKRGSNEPSAVRNRHRCENDAFYDLFIHCDSMTAFDELRAEMLANQPDQLSEIAEYGSFQRSILTGTNLYLRGRSRVCL